MNHLGYDFWHHLTLTVAYVGNSLAAKHCSTSPSPRPASYLHLAVSPLEGGNLSLPCLSKACIKQSPL